MNGHQSLSPGALLIAEVTSGGVFASLLHSMASIPPWLGGAMSALVVGAVLRVSDQTLRQIGDRIAAKVKARFTKNA